MTEQEEGRVRSEDFGNGTYEDLVEIVGRLMRTVVPKANFTVTGDENRSRLLFTFHFDGPQHVGLFLGRGMVNLQMIQQYIRSQQLFPHDRYIKIVLDKGNGQEQTFWCRKTSKWLKSREQEE